MRLVQGAGHEWLISLENYTLLDCGNKLAVREVNSWVCHCLPSFASRTVIPTKQPAAFANAGPSFNQRANLSDASH